MITRQTLNTVTPLAEKYTEQGKTLQPVEGSILGTLSSEISSSSTLVEIENSNSTFDNTNIADRVRDDSVNKYTEDDEPMHDQVYREGMEMVKEAVVGILHTARNVAKPIINTVLDEYNQAKEQTIQSTNSPAVIINNVYAPIWSSEHLDSIVDRFRNAKKDVYTVQHKFPELDYHTLYQMTRTGISSFDEQIDEIIENLPEGSLVQLYNAIFVKNSVAVGEPIGPKHVVPTNNMNRDEVLLVFLIARGFEANMPDGVSIKLDDLHYVMTRVIEQLGRVVAFEIDRKAKDENRNILVYDIENKHFTTTEAVQKMIHVNDSVYRKYLENSGTPESIYGAVLGEKNYSYDAVLYNKEDYETIYSRMRGLYNSKVSADVFTAQRDALRYAIHSYIKDSEIEHISVSKEKLSARANELLKNIRANDFNDETDVVVNLVCGVFFPHTSVKMYFDAMTEAKRSNPNMNARECALFAVIDLVPRWFAAQIEQVNK